MIFRNRMVRLGCMIVMLASIGLLGTACTAKVGAVVCDSQVHWPHESNGTPGMMDGKATIYCKGNGRSDLKYVKATIQLQKKIDGSWRSVPGTTNVRTVNTLKLYKKFGITSDGVRCARGTYRTAAKISGEFKSGSGFTSDGYNYSSAVKNPCA